jgi:hypothetical protein
MPSDPRDLRPDLFLKDCPAHGVPWKICRCSGALFSERAGRWVGFTVRVTSPPTFPHEWLEQRFGRAV